MGKRKIYTGKEFHQGESQRNRKMIKGGPRVTAVLQAWKVTRQDWSKRTEISGRNDERGRRGGEEEKSRD